MSENTYFRLLFCLQSLLGTYNFSIFYPFFHSTISIFWYISLDNINRFSI